MDRRTFIKYSLSATTLASASGPMACSTRDQYSHIKGRLLGANHKAGHLLRDGSALPAASNTINTDVLIAGGGIAGLSAMRWLSKAGITDIIMSELDSRVGGNSIYDKNEVSAYPWAAHYLPIPDISNKELIDFLKSIDVVSAISNNGQPTYNEYFICHDPEERLYIKGHWQEGLVPEFGIGSKDKQQIARFFKEVENLKHAKGIDGKFAFAIPVDLSSEDEEFLTLDRMSFANYLQQKEYSSEYLLWYLEYCCKDDYGATLQQTSAWAGLHYFASRKGTGTNVHSSDVLTSPQGNGYLMDGLRGQCRGQVFNNSMIAKIDLQSDGVEAVCYNSDTQKATRIRAKKLLLATPQYVNGYLLPGRKPAIENLQYAPWIVANITLAQLPQGKGALLSWDNVIYGQPSVGYVFANHQDITYSPQGVITFYLPLTGDPKEKRSEIYTADYDHWRKRILDELNYAHENIAAYVNQMDIWAWGHGMIMPGIGYIWSEGRKECMKPIDDKIFFAHSDLSGISIFEEAFYQGIRAANEIIRTL